MKFLLLSLLLTISFTVVLVSQTAVFAQTEKKVGEGGGGGEVNQNNLAACVDYFMNMNSNFTEELSQPELQNEQPNNRSLNKFALNAVPLITCNMGYEDTGQYTHLLSKEQQDKYIKLAANQIGLLGFQ